MPKLTKAVPKYRKHRASGQALVTIGGADHYLGPHGTKASRLEYDRLIAEWLANDRQPLIPPEDAPVLPVSEVLARFWRFARRHYRKDGKPTSEVHGYRSAMRVLRRLYGSTPVADFGPLALKAVQLPDPPGRLFIRPNTNGPTRDDGLDFALGALRRAAR